MVGGSKALGALINRSRNIALKCNSYLDSVQFIRENLAYEITNFSEVLKNHLRDRSDTSLNHIGHPPSLAAGQIFNDVADLNRQGNLTEAQFLTLNNDLTSLSDICGSCERIKNTNSVFISCFY